jgi:hypothetical protein
VATITIDFEGRNLEFTLDAEDGTWTPVDTEATEALDEGEFPLIGTLDGKRYELYSDGTFDEVELP